MKKLILIASSVVLLAGCGPQTAAPTLNGQAPTTQMAPKDDTSMAATPSPVVADTVIDVAASNFTYDKPTITVKKGDSVAVKFTNNEGMHDFVIDELGVKTQRIGAGQSETVMIPTDKAGTFAYYCSVGNHRAMGMEGKLIIE